MSEQQKFIEKIEDVVKLAKVNGRETSAEFLDEFFSDLNLEKKQMKLVYDYLIAANIKVKGYDGDGRAKNEEEAQFGGQDEGESEYLHLYLDQLKTAKAGAKLDLELVSKMKNQDENARAKLVDFFLPFVVEEAKKLKCQGMSQSDLIGEGNVGLLIGLSDLTGQEQEHQVLNTVLSAVREAMYQALDELQECRKNDSSIVQKANYIKEKAKELAEDMRDKVSVQDMADYMEMDVQEIEDILRLTGDGDAAQ